MAKKQAKSGCNLGLTGVALIVGVAGLYALVQGFVLQLGKAALFDVAGYYLVGAALMMGAKMAKWKAHEHCAHPQM